METQVRQQIGGKDDLYSEFVQLFAFNEAAVRAYVRTLLWPGPDVDDVMQNIGLACWQKFAAFDPSDGSDAFRRWACVVARFEVLRLRRTVARDRLVLSTEVLEALAADAEARVDLADSERTAVGQCLAEFDEPHRRLLLAVHTPGDAVAKIAEETGVAARKLYSKLDSLRELLRQCVVRRLTESGDLPQTEWRPSGRQL